MNARSITPQLVVADQPSEAELGELRRDGFHAVVNLRHDGEPEQPLNPEAEGERARAFGLDYHAAPIGGAPLQPVAINAVCDFIDAQLEQGNKVLVHCRKGGRASALVLLQMARAAGWQAHEALANATQLGLPLEGNLRLLVEKYLDDHHVA
jgi:uncharacterized protein (TIGR01244 family)